MTYTMSSVTLNSTVPYHTILVNRAHFASAVSHSQGFPLVVAVVVAAAAASLVIQIRIPLIWPLWVDGIRNTVCSKLFQYKFQFRCCGDHGIDLLRFLWPDVIKTLNQLQLSHFLMLLCVFAYSFWWICNLIVFTRFVFSCVLSLLHWFGCQYRAIINWKEVIHKGRPQKFSKNRPLAPSSLLSSSSSWKNL